MPDASLIPALKAALRANEIGSGDPYRLSFAGLDQSGASFGVFQADTAANKGAQSALHQILTAAGMTTARINAVMATVCKPCESTSLALPDLIAVNAAISSPQGRQIVDDLDEITFDTVLRHLDQAAAAAQAVGKSIEPRGALMIALWVNMTGAPDTLCKWISGQPVGMVRPPPGDTVTADEIEAYLRATQFFVSHPKNIDHFLASVAEGVKLLPAETAS